MVMSMVEFTDNNGQPLSLRTNVANVNMDVTPPHDLALTRWDQDKPDLGMMDQGIPAFHAVVDPEAVALSARFQPPAQAVPKESWMRKWDRTKLDLGTMNIPHIVGADSKPEEPEM
ncbi:MAG: hypothetical protein COB36_02650 [Alphaproteobacteria bacterium]|nr:MAG: hypothetical protein COB36_02650 [Alphaproteobacteria bacterium]